METDDMYGHGKPFQLSVCARRAAILAGLSSTTSARPVIVAQVPEAHEVVELAGLEVEEVAVPGARALPMQIDPYVAA